MIFDPFDVVIFSFPFAEKRGAVVRPVVILTSPSAFGTHTGVAIVAMITSARRSGWPQDVRLSNLDAAGLQQPCIVRMKLNTAALERVERKIGSLAEADRDAVRVSLRNLFASIL